MAPSRGERAVKKNISAITIGVIKKVSVQTLTIKDWTTLKK